MNSYRRPVKFKRSRIPRRRTKAKAKPNSVVLFVVIFVVIITVATVILGNYLKNRVDNTDSPYETDTQTSNSDTTLSSGGISMIEPAEGSTRSGCLDIGTFTDEEALREQIKNIFSSGFDSITIPVSRNGTLLYYSSTASALSPVPSDGTLPDLAHIINTVKSVGEEHGISPTVTAYYPLSTPDTSDPVLSEAAVLFDTAIIAEVYTLGADEVLVSGFSLDDSNDCDVIVSFIEKLKRSAPTIKLGLAFAPEVYAVDKTASYLEKISAETRFLAVDTSSLDWSYTVTEETVYSTDENGETVESTEKVTYSVIYDELVNTAASIKGSISLYGLRFLLNGDNSYSLSEAAEALYSKNAFDFYVISAPECGYGPDEYDTESDSESDSESESETEKETETKKPQKTETTEPVTTEPVTTEPVTTEPVTTEPVTTEPVTEPVTTEPPVESETLPAETDEESTQPEETTTPPTETDTEPTPDTEEEVTAPAETDEETTAAETTEETTTAPTDTIDTDTADEVTAE